MGELLAVEGIFDEVALGLRNALGAVEAPDRNARQDLRQGVFGELAGHRAPLVVGAVHAAAAAAGHRWKRRGSKLRSAAMSADAMPERYARRGGQRTCGWGGRTMAAPAGVVPSWLWKQRVMGDYRRESPRNGRTLIENYRIALPVYYEY